MKPKTSEIRSVTILIQVLVQFHGNGRWQDCNKLILTIKYIHSAALTLSTVYLIYLSLVHNPLNQDIVSLFGEQDIYEDAISVEEDTQPEATEDISLDKIDSATSIQQPNGVDISDHLTINARFQVELEPTQPKSLIEAHHIPGNCTSLNHPRENPQIWESLRQDAKSADESLTALLDALLLAFAVLSVSLEQVLNHRAINHPLISKPLSPDKLMVLHFLVLVCKVLSYCHKEALRPAISTEDKAACGRRTKQTTLPFGDDLARPMQGVKATNRIIQNISSTTPQETSSYQYSKRDKWSQNSSFYHNVGGVATLLAKICTKP